ncbi:MAG: hypothetical protein PHU59_02025 [Candidatus Omnitrophica bacterium]|jgi:tetratricopeptide (TPR) repeat protein|nr:hypothetical protein [Candidatus Omnitrophota bacterium]
MSKVILLFLVIFFLCFPAYALEWKELHEQADALDIGSAVKLSGNNPESVDDLYKLGLVYLNIHQDIQANDAFSKILLLKPGLIQARWGQAESLRRQHNLNQAESLLKQIIVENADFSPAYISLAYIKYMQMDFEESVRLALKVIQQGRDKVDLSNYARAYSMYAGAKGMIAHYGGPFSKAVNGLAVKPNLDKAAKLQPDAAGVLFGLGSYYLLAPALAGGDKIKAEVYLKKAIAADPLFADIYVRLAQLYKIKGDKEKYGGYLAKALEIDPGNELALDTQSGKCKFICTGGKD